MASFAPLVGRDGERAVLVDALQRCRSGHGGVVVVGGEAGVGKTRLVHEVLEGWDGDLLRTAATPGAPAYAPLIKLGLAVPDGSDAGAAILDSLVAAARRRATVVVIDDLHEADAATIELLARVDETLEDQRLLVLTIYRSDQLPRRHPVRALRAHLRRRKRPFEVALRPLTLEQTGELITAFVDRPVDPALVELMHARSAGVPFFVEELLWSLMEGGGLTEGGNVVSLADGATLPLPESVLDAALARTADLRERHADAVDCAATLGARVDLVALVELVAPGDVDALLDGGLLVEFDEGIAAFRHALVRDALYRAIPWARRRDLHQRVARVLTDRAAPPAEIAEHWAAAQEPRLARPLLLEAAAQACAVHAYRDAAAAGQRALAMWPVDEDPAGRLETLANLADCAELCGDYEAAIETWDEVAAGRAGSGHHEESAAAHQRAANAAEMLGDRARALAERRLAADGFEDAGCLEAAADQRFVLAQRLKAEGRLTEALDEAVAAGRAAESAGEEALAALVQTFEGALRSALGDGRLGVEIARSGLERAVAGQLTEATAEAFYELAAALEYAADYAAAVEAYETATDLCREHNLSEFGELCFVCTSPVVRLMGDWDRVLEICSVIQSDDDAQEFTRRVADEESGLVAALRGDGRKARGPLRRAAEFGHANGIFGIEVGALWGLDMFAALDDDPGGAGNRVTRLVERCGATEECHYALPALRWSASYLATCADGAGVADVHRVIANQAVRNASPKVLSTLAHAAAELARLEGNLASAEQLMGRSLDLLTDVTAPYEKALTTFRWGQIAAAAGRREDAIQRLVGAYRIARQLGARPLSQQCSVALAAMGEQVDVRLGRVAARAMQNGGLTRREQEVLAHLAQGKTNKEIAASLFVSVRTVDMHVRHLLEKLDCSSRAAAVQRAAARGLVTLPAE